MRGHLEHVAAAHPAERHAVVEEQRARILFANPLSLQAEAREDEQLRVNGKLSASSADCRKPLRLSNVKLKLPGLELPVHVHDHVVQWCG